MGMGQDQWGMAITMENFVGSLHDIIYIYTRINGGYHAG